MARVRRSIWRASDDLSSQSRPVVCTAGRSTMLLTLEDFAFFCEEFKLPVSNAQLARLARGSGTCPAVSYAQISLIEIGGDHLDRMMAQKEHSRWMGGCLRRSEHLVRSQCATSRAPLRESHLPCPQFPSPPSLACPPFQISSLSSPPLPSHALATPHPNCLACNSRCALP